MSDQTPQGDFSPGFDDPAPSRNLDGRALRALLAGAAGVAVLGAFTGGYLWVSSSPSGDTASAVVPGVSPGSTSTGTATGASDSFAFGGRDIFDGSFLPADTADGVVGSADGTTSGSTGSSGTTSSTGSTVATGTTKPVPAGSSGSASTGSTGRAAVTTPAPSGGSSAAPTTSPSPVPTPSRSTAAPWQKGSVKFMEILKDTSTGSFLLDAGGINPVYDTLKDGALLPSTSTVYRPQGTEAERAMDEDEQKQCQADKRALTGDALDKKVSDTKDCTVTFDFVYQPVLVPSKETRLAKGAEASGWVLQSKTQVPDAALGKVTGTVRWLATRGETVLVQVGNAPGQWVEKGDAVDGTPLTFADIGLDSIDRGDIAVFSDGTTQYFTILGGGEGSGVTF